MCAVTGASGPAETDPFDLDTVDTFGAANDNPTAETIIESNRSLVGRQTPDKRRWVAFLGQGSASSREKAAAEAEPLEFRHEIQFENLAAIGQEAHPACAKGHVARNAVVKIKHQYTATAG